MTVELTIGRYDFLSKCERDVNDLIAGKSTIVETISIVTTRTQPNGRSIIILGNKELPDAVEESVKEVYQELTECRNKLNKTILSHKVDKLEEQSNKGFNYKTLTVILLVAANLIQYFM